MTGLIGASVLQTISKDSKYDITALVRDESKAKTLESNFGVKTVIGSHQDLDKVASLAEAAHIVFNIVSDSSWCPLA